MRFSILWFVAAAACDGGKPAPPPAPATPTKTAAAAAAPDASMPLADAVVAVVVAPDAPPPLDVLDAMPVAMVTRDHTRVLLKIQEEGEGGISYPNLAFELRDRSDHVVKRVVVMPFVDPSQAPPPRIKEARDLIDHLDLVPTAEATRDLDDYDHSRFTSDDLTVDWIPTRIAITSKQKQVLTRDVPRSWRGGMKRTDPCAHPERVEEVTVAGDAKLAVLLFRYRGNDSCWEGPPQLHVVAW